MKIYRQGDVLIRKISRIPTEAKLKPQQDRIILAFGESTGHAHAIYDLDNVEVFVGPEGQLYLQVKDETTLRHEEHAPIAIPRGNYERVLQLEYTPQAIRNVAD